VRLSVNTESEQIQVKEGIDAVIVDSVLAIRQGLTGLQSGST
jgi:glycerophosphoryl diester phosphodiesterase